MEDPWTLTFRRKLQVLMTHEIKTKMKIHPIHWEEKERGILWRTKVSRRKTPHRKVIYV